MQQMAVNRCCWLLGREATGTEPPKGNREGFRATDFHKILADPTSYSGNVNLSEIVSRFYFVGL